MRHLGPPFQRMLHVSSLPLACSNSVQKLLTEHIASMSRVSEGTMGSRSRSCLNQAHHEPPLKEKVPGYLTKRKGLELPHPHGCVLDLEGRWGGCGRFWKQA